MQIISSILKIERGLGSWVTDDGYTADSPSFLLGVQALLEIDLRAPAANTSDEGSLPAYPATQLSGLSYIFAMDLDYNQETACKFTKTSGITIAEDESEHLVCTLPLPNTNTSAMRTALSTAASLTFNCELIARNSSDQDVFAVQFPIVVRNRVLLGTATASPDTTSPDWLPTVTAIVQSVVTSNASTLKGDDGEDGEDGKSAYEVWKEQDGNSGKTVAQFLASLKGDPGETGATGSAGTLAIGTVTTLAAGASATATIANGKLNLGIPQGAKGDTGNALCFAFSATSDTTASNWHSHCLSTDLYWRFSEDNGVTWTAARPLQAPAVAPVARFSSVAQTTNPTWSTPTQESEYVQFAANAAYFRVKMSGYPWSEPRLANAPSGVDNMTASQIAEQETILKATSLRAQFSADNQSWHASIQTGDLYIRIFSTTGTVLATWDLSAYGTSHALTAIQTSPTGPQWHDNPQSGDKYMKISLDGGETWYSNCFVIAAEQVSGGSSSSTASLTIGTVTTLAAGSQATASIVNGVLNLGIPRGADGEDGEDGEDGTGSGVTLSDSTPSVLASAASAGTASTAARADHVHPTTGLATSAELATLQASVTGKQEALVSGTNIKTINGESILGSGNLTVAASSSSSSSSSSTASTDCIQIARSVADVNAIADQCDAENNKFFSFLSLVSDTTGTNDFGVKLHGGHPYAAMKFNYSSSTTWVTLKWRGCCPGCWYYLNSKYMVWYKRTGFTVHYHYSETMSDGETVTTDADVKYYYSTSKTMAISLEARVQLNPKLTDLEDGTYSMSGDSTYLRLVKSGDTLTWAYENPYTGNTYGDSDEIEERITSFDYIYDEECVFMPPDPSTYPGGLTVEKNTISTYIVTYIVIDLLPLWQGFGTNVEEIEATSGAASVKPGGNYLLELDADTTLNAPGGESGHNLSSCIDVKPGTYTLTAGTNLSLANNLTASKINHCEIRWWGKNARLHVIDVEDIASSSDDSGDDSSSSDSGSGTSSSTDGYWTIASSGITGCDGTYNPTGDTVTTTSGTFPVYSNGTYYIFACENMAGTSSPFLWALHTSIVTEAMSCTAYKTQSSDTWSGMAVASVPQPVFTPDYTGKSGAYLEVTTTDSTKSGRYYLYSGTSDSPSAIWRLDTPVSTWYILGVQGTYCYYYIKNASTSAASTTSTAIYGSSWNYDPTDGADAIFASGVTYGSTTTTYHAS